MKRFLLTTITVLLAACMLSGCFKKKERFVTAAEIRLDQDDPEASLKLAQRGMAELQLEMSPGTRYLLADYKQRAVNNFKGYIVCGDALELMKDPHGAALAYWAAANYMRRIPFSPVAKGKNMRYAYNKLKAHYTKHNFGSSVKLVDANLALAGVYANSGVVANMQRNYQRRWNREQVLIKAKKAAQVKLAIATAEVGALLIQRMFSKNDPNYQWKLRRAQHKLQIATGEYNRAKAALDAVKTPAPAESFALIRQGNFPATMGMHFFSNFAPNRAANANAVANALRGAGGTASNAVTNAAATGNTNAMIAGFARLERQTYMQEAGGR